MNGLQTVIARSLRLRPMAPASCMTANEQLYLRMMSGLESHPVPGTDEEAEGPFFSPDSQWIAYFSITDL